MDNTLTALNRFGLGARMGERASVRDPRAWLRAQLEGRAPDPTGAPALREAVEALSTFLAAQRARDRERVVEARRAIGAHQARVLQAVFTERVTTDRPYVERLVAFWANHLCVSTAAGPPVAALAGHYERTVVRPHVLGRFEDMVLASAKHPAMLVYLDNARSVGPGSRAARQAARRGRERGLNENYARELLELHTLGVDGGYTQQDVEELARVLTGWTVAGLGPQTPGGEDITFAFQPAVHEPGAKTVLGVRYARAGLHQGEQVIRDLCAHPSTAAFVAEKLVRHFVSDTPPRRAVDRVALTFHKSGGDLRAVALELVELEEAWAPDSRKFRTPQDWLVAVLRALRADEAPEGLPRVLVQLRHTPWAPPSPKGWGDTESEWADPDSLMNRAELSRSLPRGPAATRLDPTGLLDVVDVAESDPLTALLSDSTIPRPERVSLAFGGPAFQWR